MPFAKSSEFHVCGRRTGLKIRYLQGEKAESNGLKAMNATRLQTKRGSGPKALAEILPVVSAKLGVNLITSIQSREADPTWYRSRMRDRTTSCVSSGELSSSVHHA
jgi:hypothetical protein